MQFSYKKEQRVMMLIITQSLLPQIFLCFDMSALCLHQVPILSPVWNQITTRVDRH